jgi:hypothetical protein
MPVNYGVCGYGPQQMLLQLENSDFSEQTRLGHPVLIYLCIPHHLNRLIGSMKVTALWGENMPYYFIKPDGEFVHNGSFTTGRPLLSSIYKLLAGTHFGQYMIRHDIDLPFTFSDKEYTLFSKVLERSQKAFSRKFKSEDFYVVLYPSPDNIDRLLPFLQKSGIKYLDYRGHQELLTEEYSLADNHPKPQAYAKLAKMIAADIKTCKQ